MRFSGVSGILLAVVAALVSAEACSSGGGGGGQAGTSGSAGTGASGLAGTSGSAGTSAGAGTAGAAGSTGASGTGAGTAGAAGQSAAGADGGAAGTGGMAGTTSTGGTSGGAGTGAAGTGAAGTGAAGTGAPAVDLTKVAPTAGCGKPAPQALGMPVHGMIMTSGTKDADCADTTNGTKVCGPWSLQREYYLTLPAGYDPSRAHPLIIEGSSCGSTGMAFYALDGNNVGATAIRVSLVPPPSSIGHATNPNQGCFDDKEGDDSIELVFYETLWDSLANQLCFDKNRVFAMGYASGGNVANELGCKYAGDAKHPIRAVLPVRGTLPPSMPPINTPQLGPTCGTRPMAGMWIWEADITDPPPITSTTAVERAYLLNGCTMGAHYQNAPREPFPIGGGNADDVCKKLVGCPDQFPLVLCIVQPGITTSYPAVANPGFTTFLKLFSAAPLLTP
jgi:poly(3-hydroxybutyrate) depolymerase